MRNTFSVEQIRDTKTYRLLADKKEQVLCNFLEQRTARHKMYHAYLVYKNIGVIPGTVDGMYKSVVEDFISLDNTEIDASIIMTAEEVTLTDNKLKCGNPNPPCSGNLKFGVLECTDCEWGE